MYPTITIEHDGTQYYADVMTIKSTNFGIEDHGILTCMLYCEGSGSGVGVGGYALDAPNRDEDNKFTGRIPTAYGLDVLVQIMAVVKVESWEKLPGKVIYVLREDKIGWGSQAVGIANPLDHSKVFVFNEHAKKWTDDE